MAASFILGRSAEYHQATRSHVRYWHLTDRPTAPEFVGYWTNNGQKAARRPNNSAAIDPKRTSAVRAMERNPLLGLRVCPLEVRHAQQDYCSNYSVGAVGFDSCYCSVEFNRPID